MSWEQCGPGGHLRSSSFSALFQWALVSRCWGSQLRAASLRSQGCLGVAHQRVRACLLPGLYLTSMCESQSHRRASLKFLTGEETSCGEWAKKILGVCFSGPLPLIFLKPVLNLQSVPASSCPHDCSLPQAGRAWQHLLFLPSPGFEPPTVGPTPESLSFFCLFAFCCFAF